MLTLYIIGNGFDLFNGLKTRYSDFHEYVIRHFPDLENKIEEYFHFETDWKYLWKNFEHDLSSFNYKSFFDDYNHIEVTSESFKPSELFSLVDEISEEVDNLVDEIREAFTEWISDIGIPNEYGFTYRFPEHSIFINFNYTTTLESLYGIPKKDILYIHNNADDYHGELIFGHGQSEEFDPAPPTFDEYGEPTRTPFTDSENASRYPFYALMKNTEEVLSDHEDFFKNLPPFDDIIVLGHSLGKPDWPYFKLLNHLSVECNWRLSFYSEEERHALHAIAIEELGIPSRQIRMVKMEDEIIQL